MKKKIILWLLPMLVLFAGMGGYAMVLFHTLGGKIDVILRENYRSVLAGQQMKEALEQMDSGAFFFLVGEEQRGRQLIEQNRPVFQEALSQELQNITLPGEGKLAGDERSFFQEYVQAFGTFFREPGLEQRKNTYFQSLLPLATKIRGAAQEIIRINEENMLSANRNALEVSQQSIRYMFLVVVGGIVAALFFASRLQRSVLRPINELTTVTRDLGEGNLDQVVTVQSKDELGELASAFNRMASKLRSYRRLVNDQIVQARQMTEITLSAFPDAIFGFSLEGKINFANPAAERLRSKWGNEFNFPASLKTDVDSVLSGGADLVPTSFEGVVPIRLDEHETFLLPRVIGMRDESANLFGAILVLQDVTRFRLLDEVKTNLVSTVSHELKTPLTSIRMGLHLLLEERIGTLTPKQIDLLMAAREDSERLVRMINDLLDLARLESGKARNVIEEIYPKTLVAAAVEDFTPTAEAHGCRLTVRAEAGLPLVAVDAGQIHHVFSNLVSNAAKHSKPGSEIIIEVKRLADRVRFSVLDQGPGIPLEYQAKVFERFFRIPGTERTGAGLGLAIVKEIISSLDGQVGLKSRPGQGSEFYFELPIHDTRKT
jgi:NtrC-family two-component system sensor histidine kinase KinB